MFTHGFTVLGWLIIFVVGFIIWIAIHKAKKKSREIRENYEHDLEMTEKLVEAIRESRFNESVSLEERNGEENDGSS